MLPGLSEEQHLHGAIRYPKDPHEPCASPPDLTHTAQQVIAEANKGLWFGRKVVTELVPLQVCSDAVDRIQAKRSASTEVESRQYRIIGSY